MKALLGSQRERAHSSMDYEAYQKTLIYSATPLMKPLDAPTIPPPILLEPEAVTPDPQPSEAESDLVVRLLKDHITKQNREIAALKQELHAVRCEYDVLLEKYTEAQSDSIAPPPSTLLDEAIRSRSSSAL